MRAEYFSKCGSFTNKYFCSGSYISNLFDKILSIKFFDMFNTKLRGYPILTNVLCRDSIFDIKLAQFVQILYDR